MIKNKILRSTGAVFAGILANFVIAVPTDLILHGLNIFPPSNVPLSDPLCALALSYRMVAAVAGGYLTGRLAPERPLKHALILGAIGVVLSSAGTYAMWDKGPHWYPLSLIVISLPLSWLGAKTAQRTGQRAPARDSART